MNADARAWEALVRSAKAAARAAPSDAAELGAAVKAVAGRVIPASAHRDQAAFEALRALGRAFSCATTCRRARLASALACMAEECSDALQHGRPAPRAEAARSWRDRADCGDGA